MKKKLCGMILVSSALVSGCISTSSGLSEGERTAAYTAIKEAESRIEQEDSWKTDPIVLVHLLYGKNLEIPSNYRKLPNKELREAIKHHMQVITEKVEDSVVQWPVILGAGHLESLVAIALDKRGDVPSGGDNLSLKAPLVTNDVGNKIFVMEISKTREENEPNEAGVTPPRLAETWGIPPQAEVVVSMRLKSVLNMFPMGNKDSEMVLIFLKGDDLEISYQGPRCEWPPYKERLPLIAPRPSSSNAGIIRIDNEGLSPVKVGIRSNTKGIDLIAPAKLFVSTWLPEGKYDIYFQHTHDPKSLYQGDSFELEAGEITTIQLKEQIGGNYNVRKVQ